MQIYFHSRLCSYLSRVPILVEGTVCVYIYIYIYVYMCVYMYVCMCMYICVCVCVYSVHVYSL